MCPNRKFDGRAGLRFSHRSLCFASTINIKKIHTTASRLRLSLREAMENFTLPTTHLPPIRAIPSVSYEGLLEAVEYLRRIYNPPVRGSRRRKRSASHGASPRLPSQKNQSGVVSSADSIRTDSFERDYSMKWLTALLAKCTSGGTEYEERSESLIQSAASLLAVCAGTASAGVITRTIAFDLPFSPGVSPYLEEGTNDARSTQNQIRVELTDVPLDNSDYGSVGAQTWGGSCILAEMIVERPVAFGLPIPISTSKAFVHPDMQYRYLELGAGTGLISLAIGKLLERELDGSKTQQELDLHSTPQSQLQIPHFEIVATDYYASVLANLSQNIESNFPNGDSSTSPYTCAIQISAHPLDWSVFSSSSTIQSNSGVLQRPFDTILGADIVYEAKHAEWIKGCVVKLLRKPQAGVFEPTFHLIIPLRSTHTAESSTIETAFRAQGQPSTKPPGGRDEADDLVIKHKEIIICDTEDDSRGEVEYAYYKIGWETREGNEEP